MLGRTLNPATGTLNVVLLFPNPGDLLRPGQFARVRTVIENRPDTIVVPQSAVQYVQGTRSVLVVEEDTVSQRTISKDGENGEGYIISQGREGGEKVMVEGAQKVKPGEKVNAVPYDARADGRSR